jgi:hypothetical protein
MNKKREEFLKICRIRQGEEHHIKQARQDYICKFCNQLIIKGNFYYAVLSTLAIGYRRIANVTVARLCIECAKKGHNGYATDEEFEIK